MSMQGEEGMIILTHLQSAMEQATNALHRTEAIPNTTEGEELKTAIRSTHAMLQDSLLLLTAPGPTGDYPEGKMSEQDEGGLMMVAGNKDGQVFLCFGTPVSWISFGAEQAKEIAANIANQAMLAEGKEKEGH